jgi:hypothetical protein
MKTTKRLVLGFLSSLLLAAGFVRAADSLDPVLKGSKTSNDTTMSVADGCTAQCWAIDDGS